MRIFNSYKLGWILFLYAVVFSSNASELKKGYIGPLSVGVSVFEYAKYDVHPSVIRKRFEEDFFLEYIFNIKGVGKVQVLLGEDDLIVYKLATTSEKLKTSEGAYVGLPFNKLKSIYPSGKLEVAWESNDSFYSFILPDNEGVFVFDAKPILEKCGNKYPDCEKEIGDLPSISFFTY